ncbi:energy-coupling factor transporter ATPase [Arabiibacter massiliensis]|uniref:energy-coupling factor transporter ATPase n=1 Tax=Arabiibacter massiliensis TaxID=1870985 RepID=UPI0009B9D6B3|nr:energy-coupling factor transporter ATPase [Arabiibacter massiliensis]
MPIAFEGVSYSYVDPERQEKRKRRVRRRREAGVIADPPSLEKGAPAWGSAPDAVWALRDIDFALEDGEFLGVAGHTGSGKSTLIQHMNGLVRPTRGRVLLDGQDLADKRVAQACRGKVGLVFQYPEHQLFAATVQEDVAFGPRNLGLSDEEVDARVRSALRSVRLDPDEVGPKSPFELSGGQQRRVAFAGVLAMEPSTLVLDEPVAGLDPVAREEFLDLIDELHRSGLTVVMVSHSMDDLARLADRVLVLNEGRQFAFGTPAEVFSRGEELRAIGLDAPAAQKLAAELRAEGLDLPRELYGLGSLAEDLAKLYAASRPAGEADHA